MTQLVEEIDGESLNDLSETSKHFLSDSEMENGSHRVFDFAMEILDALTLSEKQDIVFEKLKLAPNLKVAVGPCSGNLKMDFTIFTMHTKTTLWWSEQKLWRPNRRGKIKNVLSNTDVMEAGTNERINKKWNFYKLTGCEAVLPEPLSKNHSVNCLTYEENRGKPYNDNLCTITAVTLHLFGHEGLEKETPKTLTLFLQKIGWTNPASLQGVCTNDVPILKTFVKWTSCCTTKTLLKEQRLESLPAGMLASIRILFNLCDTTVTFVMSLISMYFLDLTAAHRVIHHSTKFWASPNHLQWITQNCVLEERVSASWNAVWQTWLVWYPLNRQKLFSNMVIFDS